MTSSLSVVICILCILVKGHKAIQYIGILFIAVFERKQVVEYDKHNVSGVNCKY